MSKQYFSIAIPRNRPEKTHVNLSSSFVMRCRCKHCGSFPKTYWYHRIKSYAMSPDNMRKQFCNWQKFQKRLCDDYLEEGDPSQIRKMSAMNFNFSFKNYSPRYHKNRGSGIFDITEYIECDCGLTLWAFGEKAGKNRPEINQRKSRYKYPHKFDF